MVQSRYRYLIPSAVTFLSLASGISAILAAATGNLTLGGILILASYILDLFDGELARRLDATSAFGLQIDSLTDMVSLGVAPAVLAFFHLRHSGDVSMAFVWPFTVLYTLAGAFRLARFNLLPMKKGQTDSVGLTISTGGATLTLGILSDLANSSEVMPDLAFIPLMAFLSILMVSRIAHPSLTWLFSRRWVSLLYMAYFGITIFLLRLPFVNIWFLFNSGYLGASLVRAGYRMLGD
jgi:CDP-diacylglycerol--serine O-phosphatidyltransferase